MGACDIANWRGSRYGSFLFPFVVVILIGWFRSRPGRDKARAIAKRAFPVAPRAFRTLTLQEATHDATVTIISHGLPPVACQGRMVRERVW